MKKVLAVIIALSMLATFTACGETKNTDNGGDSAPNAVTEGFAFTYSGVKLCVGGDFVPSNLPEANSVYEVPSCAIEGTDNVYNYGTFELTAFNDGTKEIIYSIYILDANTPTDEGLYLGDNLARIETIYGTDYQRNGNEIVFEKGNSRLIFILQNEMVISIELRMPT